LSLVLGVSFDVAKELRPPIILPRRGHAAFPTSRVLVPEAAVNEYGPLQAREREIRRARQVAPMQTKAEAEGVGHASHRQFGRHVLAADSAHVLATPIRAQFVHSPRIITSRVSSTKHPDKGPKLNARHAREIRQLHAEGEPVLKLADQFDVSDQAIKDVLNFETWVSAGGPRRPVTQ
jgi:hypothetical protein